MQHVIDATKPVEVTVTAKDGAAGRKLDEHECAMAKAVCRKPGVDGAIIGVSYSYVIQGDTATRYKTPVSVSREIVSFDRHRDFAPGQYGLSPISPSQRLGVRTGSRGEKNRNRHTNPIVHKATARVRVLAKGR